MKKGFPISRNVRAQWMLQHIDTIISLPNINTEYEEIPDLEIVSILPSESNSWKPETRHQYLYKITSSTSIQFLAYKYRIVFSLDLSPSLATVVSLIEYFITYSINYYLF